MADIHTKAAELDATMKELQDERDEKQRTLNKTDHGDQWDKDLDGHDNKIRRLVTKAKQEHKELYEAEHSDATKHFPKWFRSPRWRGTKIKGGRRTRRSRRKRRRVRRKRTRKRHRRSRIKRRRFKKRTKKR